MTDPDALLRRGLLLEYVTLAWNSVEAALVLYAAWSARSIGLAGFGLDSLIELFASVVVIWQLKGVGPDREPMAMRLLAAAFLGLALYILVQSAVSLSLAVRPRPSPLGLATLAATVAAMSALAWGKLAVGRRLGNRVLITEARVTLMDAALAATVFAGVGLNALFGWWQADPICGGVIAVYALVEAREAWGQSRAATA